MERMVKYITVNCRQEEKCSALLCFKYPLSELKAAAYWRFQHTHVPLEQNLGRESSDCFGRALCSTAGEAECVSSCWPAKGIGTPRVRLCPAASLWGAAVLTSSTVAHLRLFRRTVLFTFGKYFKSSFVF